MKYLDDFVVVYLNDILIYSNSIENHRRHVKKMLQKLKKTGIQIDIDKCEFHVVKTKFLKMIVDRNGVRMNSKKIIVIQNWKTSRHFQQMQFFLKFINFYRRFIKNFEYREISHQTDEKRSFFRLNVDLSGRIW